MLKEMKLQEILSVYESIKNILDDKTLDVNLSFKFKLLGIMNEIAPFHQNFEMVRNDLIRKYGSKDNEDQVSIKMDDHEALEKFQTEIGKLLETELEVNVTSLSPTEVFNSKIKSEYLMGIYSIINVDGID